MSAATAKVLSMGKPRNTRSFQQLDPPRMVATKQIRGNDRIWQTAIDWIDNHQGLVNRLGGSDGKKLMEPEDLIQHAYIIAYEIVGSCMAKGNLDEFVGQFIDTFRLSVIFEFLRQNFQYIQIEENIEHLSWHGDTSGCQHLQDPETCLAEKEYNRYVNRQITVAIQSMTKRQQRFWNDIFSTPGVKTISDACRVTGLNDNKGRELLHRSLQRVRVTVC